jgi:broad specificity phosphatase PhoE
MPASAVPQPGPPRIRPAPRRQASPKTTSAAETESRLILLRHGRTSWNAAGRFQGQADPPLDGTGLRQARRAANALSVHQPGTIISSDLRRAHQTAMCLAEHYDLRVQLDAALREQALGAWEGLERAQAAERYPDEFQQWLAGFPVRRGGGETEHEAGARVCRTLTRELRQASGGRSIVVVSHGLALRAALTQLLERHLVDFDDAVTHLDNGCWVALRIRTGR